MLHAADAGAPGDAAGGGADGTGKEGEAGRGQGRHSSESRRAEPPCCGLRSCAAMQLQLQLHLKNSVGLVATYLQLTDTRVVASAY